MFISPYCRFSLREKAHITTEYDVDWVRVPVGRTQRRKLLYFLSKIESPLLGPPSRILDPNTWMGS